MKSQRFVERGDERRGHHPDAASDAFYCNGSDLLGLGFGIPIEASVGSTEQHLERVDELDVGCHRNDRDHAATESFSDAVRAVVADDHGRADAWPPRLHAQVQGRRV